MADRDHPTPAGRAVAAPPASSKVVHAGPQGEAEAGGPTGHPSPAGVAGGRRVGAFAAIAARADREMSTGLLQSLQRRAGNVAVQRMLEVCRPASLAVQRGCGCGTCSGCAGETAQEGEESQDQQPATVSRQVPPAPAAPAPAPPVCTVKGASPLEQADDAFAQGTPECLDKAWGILLGSAMYDQLPLLEGLKAKGKWARITADAAGRGGPRMVVATEMVDLKARGTPITKAELRTVVDKVATLPADQRSAIFKYLGKHVSITVQGIDIDLSYCQGATGASCEAEIRTELAWSKKMIAEYSACRKPSNKNSTDVETCVHASLGAQGIGTAQAGGTSASGAVTVTASPITKCQPIVTRSTEIHEGVHQATTLTMQKKYGAGTPAFQTAWHDAKSWIDDEVNAYGAEVKFYGSVLGALTVVCKALAGP